MPEPRYESARADHCPTIASGGVRLVLRADNYACARAAYGEAAAQNAMARLGVLAQEILPGVLVSARGRGELRLAVGADVLGRGEEELAVRLAAMQAALTMTPMIGDGCIFHLNLSVWRESAAEIAWHDVRWGLRDLAGLLPEVGDVSAAGEAPGETAEWAEGYRRDMADAARLLSAIRRGRVFLVWQPVCRADGESGEALYYEGLARLAVEGREALSCFDLILAAERIGLVRAFDQAMLSLALEEAVRRRDHCLGVNISACSARLDSWWFAALRTLGADGDLAERLVIEITETERLPADAEATRFVDCLRKSGARIAVDDFGVGHASIRRILTLSPDIVKIDALFVRLAAESSRALATFNHLVGLGRALGRTVVVEGIETQDHRRLALAAGGVWQQGYLLGRPARAWSRYAAGDRGGAFDTAYRGQGRVVS